MNRAKLRPYCTVDKYDKNRNKWIPSYIENHAVYGDNDKHSQWSNEVKYCSLLLKLGKHSNIFVFDIGINQWCRGTVVDVETFQNLNIFTVFYRKENKIYQQYVHQFSSRIALTNKTCDCDSTAVISQEETSNLDKQYFRQCVNITKGYIQQIVVNCNSFEDNELVFILQKYVGCIYGLVINIESKTWLSAIKRRNESLMPKDGTIHNECLSLYENGSLLFIQHNINKVERQLNANAASFVPSKTKIMKKQKKCASPYKTEYVKNIQKRVRIPRRLTETMCLYTNEKLSNPYYYLLIMIVLQFELINTYNKIIIFNTNLHDTYCGNNLYAIAKREHSHGYEWIMMDILYSVSEINNQFGNKICLQNICISFEYIDYDNIMSILLNRKQFIQIVNNTNWCRIKVYNRINNKNRLEFKVTKTFFNDMFVRFINQNNKYNLIPILFMENKTYLIEYLLIIQLSKNNTQFDVAVSFKYYMNHKFNVVVTGIHIDKEYIIQQHELIHSNCNCLDNFKPSDIDVLRIGNPDDEINKTNAKDQTIKKLKQQIKHLNQK